MARRHSMTPARRAALRKAQAASARKRRGKGHTGRRHTKPTKRAAFRKAVGTTLIAGSVTGHNPVSYGAAAVGSAVGATIRYKYDMRKYKNSKKKPVKRRKRR